MDNCQISLPTDELPKKWYNIIPDLPEKLPEPKEPGDGKSRFDILQKTFIKECLKQSSSTERWITIPDEIRELYLQAGRPRPLYRARRLEKKLNTPARLYYKREDLSPTGSHKVNTALAQAYYAAEEGFERLTTETGAGQWGSALAYAARLMDLECTVYWVRHVYNLKPERKILMDLYGADVYASPSERTEIGKKLLKEDRNHPGSLGIAISEGLEDALNDEKAVYCLGSVLNHVLMHQTIIGLETQKQFEMVDDYPDIMIGCLGGGSNFGGFALPFIGENLKKRGEIEFLAAQSEAAPNLVEGKYEYDFGDVAEQTPLLKMYTLGHKRKMDTIYADGLRYHAAAPIISLLRKYDIVKAKAYPKDEKSIFEAAKIFMRAEGFIPAPESSYAIRAAIDEALRCKESGEKRAIAFNVSGHGFLDLTSYREVLFGKS